MSDEYWEVVKTGNPDAHNPKLSDEYWEVVKTGNPDARSLRISNLKEKRYESNIAMEMEKISCLNIEFKLPQNGIRLMLHSSGVFSNVYRGTLLSPGPRKEIALKKTWPDFEGDSQVNTELNILLGLSCRWHKNIIRVLYTFRSITPDNKIFLLYPSFLNYICETMIFEYLPKTMSNIVKQIGGKYPDYIDIKLYSWQLFNGLSFLSNNHICHRDIKPQNLLIEPISGVLKIADFGSAKFMRRMTKSTSYQVTRYYRPPELLLKATYYSPQVGKFSIMFGLVVVYWGKLLKAAYYFPARMQKISLN
ncbi:unnamed protein product [Brugia timori]|uniref:Protein kinase domain-containing protein n=1 Tax=Brugia timori TaxID=42155 RepID=A0A3P7XK39_9BILA|nr:unnamed protein product [Brugia timori]